MSDMFSHKKRMILALIIMLHLYASASSAAEIGFDAGATLQLVDDDSRNFISVASPAPGNVGILSVQSTRVALPVSHAGQIEASLGFSMISEEQFFGGRRSLAHLLMGASYLHDLTHEQRHTIPYVRGGGHWRQIVGTGQPALTQFGLGGGVGMKWRPGRVLGIRVQGTTTRWFQNTDIRGHWDLGFSVGISAFTS